MSKYSNLVNNGQTPQSEPLNNRQVKNDAGGYSFKSDPMTMFHRFLILGSSEGCYYTSAESLTKLHFDNIKALASTPNTGIKMVDMLVDVSLNGKAPKLSPTHFALAVIVAFGHPDVKSHALNQCSIVLRTASHLMEFLSELKSMKSINGRAIQRMLSNWYKKDNIGLQMAKYRTRNGFSHKDIIHLGHIKPSSPTTQEAFSYLFKDTPLTVDNNKHLYGYEFLKKSNGTLSDTEITKAISEFNLSWEMIPTEYLSRASVWEALLPNLGGTALLRNLGKLSSVGLLTPNSSAENFIVEKFSNSEFIQSQRLHPINILFGNKVYSSGRGLKGSNSWNPSGKIVGTLDDAFYKAFVNVMPTGKKIHLALDVSGSMLSPAVAGVPISARELTSAFAAVWLNTEENVFITAFTNKLVPVALHKKMSLNEIMQTTSRLQFGTTDCSQPMIYSTTNKQDVDAFIIMSDGDTWAGNIHPTVALADYRKKSRNTNAKFVTFDTKASRTQLVDPLDSNSAQFTGFSTDTPALIQEFLRF